MDVYTPLRQSVWHILIWRCCFIDTSDYKKYYFIHKTNIGIDL
jgi:hypothetical protein